MEQEVKNHTDIKQSKILSKIIPVESADLYFMPTHDGYDLKIPYNGMIRNKLFFSEYPDRIPSWSLSALLSILPNNGSISTTLSKGGYIISTLEYTNSWFVDYEDETDGLNNCVTSAKNPIDACYQMILKLHERKLL